MEFRIKGFAFSSVISFIVFSCLFSVNLVCVIFSLMVACITDTVIRMAYGNSQPAQRAVKIPRIQEDLPVFENEEVEKSEQWGQVCSEPDMEETVNEEPTLLKSARPDQEAELDTPTLRRRIEELATQDPGNQKTATETAVDQEIAAKNAESQETVPEKEQEAALGNNLHQEPILEKVNLSTVSEKSADEEMEKEKSRLHKLDPLVSLNLEARTGKPGYENLEAETENLLDETAIASPDVIVTNSDSTEHVESVSFANPVWKWDREDIDLNDPEVAAAATKIQATFRGHKVRKTIDKKDEEGEEADDVADIDLTDPDLANAATKIQASFRGHLARKQAPKDNHEKDLSTELGKLQTKDDEEEVDIDLADPELQKAAVKIQASFRGHMVRRDNEDK